MSVLFLQKNARDRSAPRALLAKPLPAGFVHQINLAWRIMQRFLLANASDSLAETASDIFWRSFQISAVVDFAMLNFSPTTLCEAPVSRDCTISNFFPNVKTARFRFPRIPPIAVLQLTPLINCACDTFMLPGRGACPYLRHLDKGGLSVLTLMPVPLHPLHSNWHSLTPICQFTHTLCTCIYI